MTEVDPPIEKRTTEQLLDIIETREQWRDDVIRLTQSELIKRGIPVKLQETRRKNRTKFGQKIQSIKARATYTLLEKLLIVLLGPLLVVILDDIFIFHAGDGFKKKNWQGLFYMLTGFALWILVFYVIYS